MADYIPREAVLDLAYWHGEKATVDDPNPDGVDAVDVSDIEAIPAADVVEVVLCRDCKYSDYNKENEMYCYHCFGLEYIEPVYFCSYGEREEQMHEPD